MRAHRRNWTLADVCPKSLSLKIFYLFSLCRCSEDAGCPGLRAGRAVAVILRGFRETQRSPENSRVFRRLSFNFFFNLFYYLFILLLYFFFFLSRVVTVIVVPEKRDKV